ncbi:ornithine carbamoyltransferase [Synechococcus sp. Nb3U1]|uniref:ornithine carbamoyltransferase n=1 Tax=Synechococcus sp. Nb3U1 TaxID=1914529 RepID=UPI001F16A4E4|nr:ornithine carbamoyltransferase [Synechococcus sp. Nb3U1]MCF2971844.1 ornithine carbamoyltransferase [Synechococcus sp. Nb3U1]
MNLSGRDLLKLSDLTSAELSALLRQAAKLKRDPYRVNLRGRVLGLLFEKASTRTRVSFTAAMAQCGGSTIDLLPTVMQVSRGEPLQDTARVLSRYLDVIAIRTYDQKELEAFAKYADIPVINALTDQFHPCQILADLLTIQENFGQLAGLTLAYCGDGNNVAHSLMLGCAMSGIHIRVATPPGYGPDPEVVQQAHALADHSEVWVLQDPQEAVSGSQVIYTDVWASMGQEAEAEARQAEFLPYQVNATLLKRADPEAIVLHCLPAHREEEITAAVLEGSQSRVWDQAENRLHAQKALLVQLLGAG